MEQIVSVLEREREVLDLLLFKLVETRLILEASELRFLSRATREVERARGRCREIDLMRAATVAQHRPSATLRDLASSAREPWPSILRDHHDLLAALVAEIEVTAHRNAEHARIGLDALRFASVGTPRRSEDNPGGDAELTRLAAGAALETVLGTASRLRMPDLLDFLR